ncbi:MAG: GNAT family N-acetyltransferase [Gemmataceae bacterium]|nr:GNAT family N-acetyltransferase [Gemmataceae bacterium]
MLIRTASEADLEMIVDFNAALAEESEGKTLDPAKLRPGVAAALADPHKGRYFLAEHGGRVVGQMLITYEWSDWRNGWFWWIQSVYVTLDHRRKGVFRGLFDHVRQLALAEGVIGVRLYVEKENTRAHATYQSLGLDWTSYLVMERHPM